jgi:hypothetical protein
MGNTPYRPSTPDLRTLMAPTDKEILGKLDSVMDPAKTPGREFLQQFKQGLDTFDPRAADMKQTIASLIYEKRPDGTADTFKYQLVPEKLEHLRAALQMTKEDAKDLAGLVKPPDRPLYIGDGGVLGSAAHIENTRIREGVKAVLDAKSTLGQGLALWTMFRGGTPDQIRAAGDAGSSLTGAAGAMTAATGARDANVAMGRAWTKDNVARANQPVESRPGRTEASMPKNPLIESRNAQLSAFGSERHEGAKGTFKDPFDGSVRYITSSRIASPGANTANRAAIAEDQAYRQIQQDGKVGIQSPGRVHDGGPDFIMYDPATKKIQVYDTKLRGPDGSYPKPLPSDQLRAKWGDEIGRAVNGWTDGSGRKVGGVDTGNAALDEQIRQAWRDRQVDFHQLNVRGPELPSRTEFKDGPL